jgi:beta-xylosidase
MKQVTKFFSLMALGCGLAAPVMAAGSMPQQRVAGTAVSSRQFANPVLWADVPDPDVIRVGRYFYMVSTTMHLMPGAPIMRSEDLVNWETIGYVFDKLTDSHKYSMIGGTVYGRGQWATSLKYHKGKFYVLFAPNDNPGGETYIYSADDPAGKWTLVSRLRHFHDASLFFDDDDRVYVFYGTGQLCELEGDLSAVKEGSECRTFQREPYETGLLEGSRVVKHDGMYYLLMISWPAGKPRHQVCYRSKDIHGPYEKKTILQSEFGGFPYVGQGTIVDAPDGRWYGMIFQDRGGVGRVLTLNPCTWKDGWPMLGDAEGKVPAVMDKPVQGSQERHIVQSDDFSGKQLGLCWQWNHNPIDGAWSLTDRPGYLRLRTSKVVSNLFDAPNTLSQRLEGPKCTATVLVDITHLRDGDHAGLAAFNGDTGLLDIIRENGKTRLAMVETSVQLTDKDKVVHDVKTVEVASVPLKVRKVYLRLEADFLPGRDMARFSYSLDGRKWQTLGRDFKMRFDYRRFFMGTRAAVFCYATKQRGGYLDVDQFSYHRE